MLAEHQARIAKTKVDAATDREQQRLGELRALIGPSAFNDRKEEYRAWFSSAQWHPDSLRALAVSNEDKVLALSLVNCLLAQATTRALLLTTGLDAAQLSRCLSLTPLQLANLLAGGVTAPGIRAYTESPTRIALLQALCAAGMAPAQIAALCASLGALNSHIADPAERGHLVTLLAVDGPGDIVSLRNDAPDPVVGKLALLVAIRPKALSAADLLACLQLCKQAGSDAARIQAVFGPHPVGTALALLRAAINADIAVQYTKNADFARWLNAVDVLFRQHLATIALGGWSRLKGLPLTDHLDVTVTFLVGGVASETFCVHFHPAASGPAVGSPHASPFHVKTDRHAKTHIDWNSLPAGLRAVVPKRP